jgi:hypothetical protein
MKKKKQEVRLRKIPIDMFLEVLTQIYEKGVDYFDIIGTPDEEQDTISIIYTPEYFSKEVQDDVEKAIEDFIDNLDDGETPSSPEEFKKDIKLSDDDLNQLS